MTFKTIKIKRSAYKGLTRSKGPDESFSELFTRLIRNKKKPDLMEFYGAWGSTEAEKKAVDDAISAHRASADKDWERRMSMMSD